MTEWITRGRKPEKQKKIEMNEQINFVTLNDRRTLTDTIQVVKEDTLVKTVGLPTWLHMPDGA